MHFDDSQCAAFVDRTVNACLAAIERFATKHRADEICYFALDANPSEGDVLICFNTSASSQKTARSDLRESIKRRKEALAEPKFRAHALYYVSSSSVLPFCNNTGDFKYQGFGDIPFPEWSELALSEQYVSAEDDQDDYLMNLSAYVLGTALDILAAKKAFAPLRLASPTMVGLMYHDGGEYILHLLEPSAKPAQEG